MPFVYDSSISSSDRIIIDDVLNNLRSIPDGKLILDLLEADNDTITITVNGNHPVTGQPLSTAYSAGFNNLNININETVNARYYDILDPSQTHPFTLEDLILHELIHAIDGELFTGADRGEFNHDQIVDQAIFLTNNILSPYGLPSRDTTQGNAGDILQPGDPGYDATPTLAEAARINPTNTPSTVGSPFTEKVIYPLIRAGNGLTPTQEKIIYDAIQDGTIPTAPVDLPPHITPVIEGFIPTLLNPPAFYSLDPLAVDLNRDGRIETYGADVEFHVVEVFTTEARPIGQAVYFDMDGDGMKEATSWLAPEDGWLVRDINGNGQIDNAGEMFGGVDPVTNAPLNGFTALAALDENGDGKIDAQDSAFSELMVWQDKNGDGFTQAGELYNVQSDLFFTSIPTTPNPPGGQTAQIKAAVGDVLIENINLSVDQINTVYGGDADISIAALFQPELRGYGNLPNLSVAMSLDDATLAAAENLSALTLQEIAQDFATVQSQFNDLLYHWAGVYDTAPDSRGPFLEDARQLEFMEKIVNEQYVQLRTPGDTNPLSIPANRIMEAWDHYSQSLMGRFFMQAGADGLYETASSYDRVTDTVIFDGAPVLDASVLNTLGAGGALVPDPVSYWSGIAYLIDATHDPNSAELGQGLDSLTAFEISALDAAVALSRPDLTWQQIETSYLINLPGAGDERGPDDDVITGTEDADVLDGGFGNDVLIGNGGDDVLIGGEGNDRLVGGDGADHLIGGAGDDMLEPGQTGSLLEGGDGNDTYIFNHGVSDYIVDTGGTDQILMPSSTDRDPFQHVQLYRYDNGNGDYYDLTIRAETGLNNPDGSQIFSELVVQDQFNPNAPEAFIETIENVWTSSALSSGEISISFDMTRASIGFQAPRNPSPLFTEGTNAADTISNLDIHMNMGTFGSIESIRGHGGDDTITVSHFNLQNAGISVNGDDGNDTIIASGDKLGGEFRPGLNSNFVFGRKEIDARGGSGDDTFISLSGNNEFSGDAGNDTYVWRGGNVEINESPGQGMDTLIIDRPGESISDLLFLHPSNTLFVSPRFETTSSNAINGSFDGLHITGSVFSLSVEALLFAGTAMPALDLTTYAQWTVGAYPNANGSQDEMLAGNVVLGLDGNDILSGTAGNDVLAGGRGNDTLTSDSGSDYLDGGDGNDLFIYSKSDITAMEDTHLVGGRGLDTFELRLTGEQFADPAVQNDILLYQSFLTQHADTATLHGASFTFNSLGVTASDMEAFRLVVDDVEITNFTPPTNILPDAVNDAFTMTSGETLAGNVLSNDSDANIGQVLSAVPQSVTTTNGGMVDLQADGSFTYRAADGYFGADSFTYTADDGFGGQDGATVNITVNQAPNINPVAVDDLFDMQGHSTLSGNVLQDNGHNGFGIDYDPDGNPLSVTPETITTANGGTVEFMASGEFLYTAASGYSGTDSFTYTLNDSRGGQDIGTVNISNVGTNNLNTAPDAQDDAYNVTAGITLRGNLLSNDTDADGDALSTTWQTITTTQGGTATMLANGDFSYVSAPGFAGQDSFDYTARDNFGGQDTATVNITVNEAPNDAPVAQDDNINAAFHPGVSGNVLIHNGNGPDADPNGELLTVTAQTITTVNGGTVILQDTGDFTYTAAPGYTGADSFGYTVADGRGLTDTATVNIRNIAVNRDPTANDDAYTTAEDVTLHGNVLNNDSDPDFDTLTVQPQSITTANGSTVVLAANGSFTYTPAPDFHGTDSFTYTALDPFGGQSMGVANLTISSVADAPVAQDDHFDGTEGIAVMGNVLADNSNGPDYDGDGDALTVQAATLQTVHGGTVVLQTNGDFTYTPAAGYNGTDSFDYLLRDSTGLTDMGMVSFNLAPSNRPPDAQDDVIDAGNIASASGDLFVNDFDPDANPFAAIEQTFTTAEGNTVTINADGTFSITATEGFRGNDSFQYTIEDDGGLQDTANVDVLNLFTNRAPDAQNDQTDAANSATATGNVLANDSDPDGDALNVMSQTVTTANGGTVVLQENGDFTYTATQGFRGDDSFDYTVVDAYGAESGATAQISNIFTNQAPVAQDDSFAAGNTADVTGNLLANDSDPDNDAFQAWAQSFVTQNGGQVSIAEDGSFTYHAADLFQGLDSFTYTIDDGFGGTDSATVNLSGLVGDLVPPSITLGNDTLNAAVTETVTAHEYIPTPPDFPDLIERGRIDESAVNGVMRDNLTLSQDHDVKVNFVSEGAGYKNSLGYYVTDAAGVITSVQLLAANLSGTGPGVYGGGDFNPGDLIADLGVLEAGTQVNFFIVADGFHKNQNYRKLDLEDGHFDFRPTHDNQIADITDRAHDLDLVFVNDTTGDITKINGNVYHSSTAISNKDGDIHSLSGINENGNLQIGFEDLYKGGDHDFNDVVIEVEISPHVDHALDPVAILSDIDISDPHGGLFTEATIAFTAGMQDGDMFTLDDALLNGTGITATHNADGSLTLSGIADDITYETILQNIQFTSDASDPMAGVREFDISVTNDIGLSTHTSLSLDIANDTALDITASPDVFAPVADPVLAGIDPLLDGQNAFGEIDGRFNFHLEQGTIDAVHGGVDLEDRFSWMGRDKMTLHIDDIFEQGETFAILGDRGDTLTVKHADLTLQDTRTHDGESYNVYATSKGVTLVIDADIAVKGDVVG